MKYKVLDLDTNETLYESFDADDVTDFASTLGHNNFDIVKIIPCRGCQSDDAEMKYDAHGVQTGYWCYDCYNSSKYPYRKDKYPTIETHGHGERLDDNY